METTLVIANRTFHVEPTPDGEYWLFGKRGAKYRTHVRADGYLFLVSYTRPGSFKPDPLGPVTLTDEGGTLRVV